MDEELFGLFSRYLSLLPDVVDELDSAETELVTQVLQAIQGFIQQPQTELSQVQPSVPQGADLLWHLAGRDPQAFVSYLRTYPGQGFQELASNPNQLNGVIQQLQTRFPFYPTKEQPDGLEDTLYPSSNVAGLGYDPSTQNLLVKFHGEPVEPVYEYSGVPPMIFELLKHGNAIARTTGRNKYGRWWEFKAPSIGASVNQYLKKGGFSYTRVR